MCVRILRNTPMQGVSQALLKNQAHSRFAVQIQPIATGLSFSI